MQDEKSGDYRRVHVVDVRIFHWINESVDLLMAAKSGDLQSY